MQFSAISRMKYELINGNDVQNVFIKYSYEFQLNLLNN